MRFTDKEPSTVKILTINSGEAFSLQYHARRSEYWYVLDGEAMVTVGDKRVKALPGEDFFIKENERHRIEALGVPVRVLEISFGDFDEDDIVRVEDKYGRAPAGER